jgi:5-methylcytosine-specific restriction endonuclease McrA
MQFDVNLNIYGKEKGRKPIKKKGSVTSQLRFNQKGKCWKCHRSFDVMGVRPQTHHKNGNHNDNRISNLVLVCSNCHDKLTHKQILKGKPTKKQTSSFELPEIKMPEFDI